MEIGIYVLSKSPASWQISPLMFESAHLLVGTFHRECQDLDKAEEHYSIAKDIMIVEGHSPYQFTTSAIMYKLGCVALQKGQVELAM